MSSRLSSNEINYYRKRLDEIAGLARSGVAVVMKEHEKTGITRPVLYYRNGLVWRKRSRPLPLKDLIGWEAHYVIAREWSPLDPRSPLELLAEAAEDFVVGEEPEEPGDC